MATTRHRPTRGRGGPSRGEAGPEIEIGDPFGQYEKQGGDQPGATESGDLQSREFGVPQADVPGGLKHLVNTETIPEKTAHKGAQPADYHKFHGVPPQDLDLYTFPPQADEVGAVPRGEAVPRESEAVPVFITEGPGKGQRVRALFSHGPLTLAANMVDPVRLSVRDPYRHKWYVTCENTQGTLRIGSSYELLAQGYGLKLSNTTALVLQTFDTQDDVWIINLGANPGIISWAEETDIAVPRSDPAESES